MEAGKIADLIQTTGDSLDRLEIERQLIAIEQSDQPKQITHDGEK